MSALKFGDGFKGLSIRFLGTKKIAPPSLLHPASSKEEYNTQAAWFYKET